MFKTNIHKNKFIIYGVFVRKICFSFATNAKLTTTTKEEKKIKKKNRRNTLTIYL